MRENLVAILEGAILAADQPLSIDRMIALFDGGIERIQIRMQDDLLLSASHDAIRNPRNSIVSQP